MAKLRSALARGASAAMGGLSQGITALQQQRLEEARLAAQRQFQMELADKAHQRALDLQRSQQDFTMNLEGQKTQAQFLKELQAKRLGIATDANTPGVDPGQIAARATDAGMGDEFFPGTGSRINMPDDPRLSPEFRGKSLTNFAMPIRPEGAERPPIEQLLQQAMQSQRGGLRDDFQKRMEEFQKEEFIDPTTGVQSKRGPDGSVIAQERTAGQQGAREADVFKAVTPASVSRAAGTARAVAEAVPVIVGGENPITGAGQYSRVNRITGEENPLGIVPKTGGSGGDGTDARIQGVLPQWERFKELSKQVNTASPGLGRFITGAANVAKQATSAEQEEYARIRGPLGLNLAVIIQGSRPTDTDAKLAAQQLADFFTSGPVALSLHSLLDSALSQAKKANPQLDFDNMTEAELYMAANRGLIKPTGNLGAIIEAAETQSSRQRSLESLAFGSEQ